MKKFFKASFVLSLIIILSFSTLSASAISSNNAYNYDPWGKAIPVPDGYTFKTQLCGNSDLQLDNPMDLYYRNGKLYVLDSGNGRVLIFKDDYSYVCAIDNFTITKSDGTNEKTKLNQPKGIFVSKEGKILIADTGNSRVLICDYNGTILKELNKPKSDVFPQESDFNPVKVIMDDMDNIYVISEGFYYGSILYDKNGDFKGFYGSNSVRTTVAMLADMFWRKFMTKKQLDYSKNYLPDAITSFDIDENNFVYTCTGDENNSLKKLNALGANILNVTSQADLMKRDSYGDKEFLISNGKQYSTKFCDITVSDSNLIYALDSTNGRVFEYDSDSNLLNVFGGNGTQKGTFTTPIAIETIGEDVLVLDQDKGIVTVFTPTDYGALLHEATILYQQGLFDKATDKWEQILAQNSNYEMAYRGIGRAYLQSGNYKKAMEYAKLGQDRDGYSKAFRLYRSELVRSNFIVIPVAVVIVVAFVFIYKKFFASKLKAFKEKNRLNNILSVRNILLHPILTFEKLYNDHSVQPIAFSFIVIALFFLGQVMQVIGTGFIFNKNDVSQFNVLFVLAQSVGLVLIWTLSDMVVGSLRFGHGTIRRVFTGTASAIVPVTISLYINVFLSQVLTYEEKGIMTIISAVGILYTGYLLFQAVRVLQQYSTVEAMTSVILDIIVAIIIILLLVVVFMLMRQLVIFVDTIINELLYRL